MMMDRNINKSDEFQNTRATLETLYNISRELATALDLRTVLQRVLFLAMKHVGAMSGSIIVLDDTGQPGKGAAQRQRTRSQLPEPGQGPRRRIGPCTRFASRKNRPGTRLAGQRHNSALKFGPGCVD